MNTLFSKNKLILFSALAIFIFSVLFKLQLLNNDMNPYFDRSGFSMFILPFFLIISGLFYRNYFQNATFTFTESLKFYLTITVFALFSIVIFNFIFLLVNTSILENYILKSIQLLENTKKEHILSFGEESFQLTKINLTKTTVFDVVLSEFIKNFGIGIIFSLLLAILLRKSTIIKDGNNKHERNIN